MTRYVVLLRRVEPLHGLCPACDRPLDEGCRVTRAAEITSDPRGTGIRLFRFAGRPSRVIPDDHGALTVERLGIDELRHRLARIAEWYPPAPALDGTAGPAAIAAWETQQAERRAAVRVLDLAESARRAGPPLMRPLLEELSLAAREPLARLERALEAPPAEPLPPAASTPEAARAQWREARASFRRARVAVRRGHHRREELATRIDAESRAHTMAWWQAGPRIAHEHVGDSAAASVAAAQLRREALTRLATLGGLVAGAAPPLEPLSARHGRPRREFHGARMMPTPTLPSRPPRASTKELPRPPAKRRERSPRA